MRFSKIGTQLDRSPIGVSGRRGLGTVLHCVAKKIMRLWILRQELCRAL
ncbi:MAG TPA: hypothetical protein VF848_01985 [Steroidobacteraceae bacterium]